MGKFLLKVLIRVLWFASDVCNTIARGFSWLANIIDEMSMPLETYRCSVNVIKKRK